MADAAEACAAELVGDLVQRMAWLFGIVNRLDPAHAGKTHGAANLAGGRARAQIIDHVKARIARRLGAFEEILLGCIVERRLYRIEIRAIFQEPFKIGTGQQGDARGAVMAADQTRSRQHAHHAGQVAIVEH
jgi:hypothetical protein